MRVMLSDGSGLTSRQCATLLGRQGHEVHVLSSTSRPLARWTRYVAAVHRVPAYGPDPLAWWAAVRSLLRAERPDVLLPTQEQVAVLSLRADEVADAGVHTAVPPFAALRRVQDKVAADRTLRDAGLRRPAAWVAGSAGELVARASPPVYCKAPVGTASTGVVRVDDAAQLRVAAARLARRGAFDAGGVLVEQPVAGPLLMVQAVFAAGELVALHANERTRQGAGGGASHKTSRPVGELTRDLRQLGGELGWHGALSLDAILADSGPTWIDVNPRLVEPANAARAGVDVLGTLLAVATGTPVRRPAVGGRPGVRTHQLLLAVLGAAESGRSRRGVLAEVSAALRHRGDYADSVEELTPAAGDPVAAVPVGVVTAACLLWPQWHRAFTRAAVGTYALEAAGWAQLQAAYRDAVPR